MQVKHVMTRGVEWISPDCTVQEAAEKKKSLAIEPLPVCEGERLVGMLTDRDITVRIIAGGHDPNRCTVRVAMTPEVICCFEDQEIEEVIRLSQENQVLDLPVVDRNGRFVGIVSLNSLALQAH